MILFFYKKTSYKVYQYQLTFRFILLINKEIATRHLRTF